MFKKSICSILGLLAFSLVGGSSHEAMAGSHVFAPPIGSCVKSTGTGTIAYAWEGFLNIHASESMAIDCGVPYTIRDNTEERVVIAQVNDQSTVKKVTCTMQAFSVQGNLMYSGGSKASADTNSAIGVASLAWIMPSGLGLVDAYVSCIIPPEQSTPSGLLGVISAG